MVVRELGANLSRGGAGPWRTDFLRLFLWPVPRVLDRFRGRDQAGLSLLARWRVKHDGARAVASRSSGNSAVVYADLRVASGRERPGGRPRSCQVGGAQ